MAKLLGPFLAITRTFIIVSALETAVALPMWSISAVAQTDIRTSHEGDTHVTRTYDNKTGKLLEVVRATETEDPNDRTKIHFIETTKKYDQGIRPPYETTVDEQEILYDGGKRVVRKRTKTSTTYKKTKDKNSKERDLVMDVKEEMKLVGLDAKGVPIYEGTRTTSSFKGVSPEKFEIWDAKTRKWKRAGWTLKQFLKAQELEKLNRPKAVGEKLTGAQDNRTRDAPRDGRKHYAVDDELNRTEIIEKEPAKPTDMKTARRQQGGGTPKPEPDPGNTSPTNPADDPISLACQTLGGEWRSGTLPIVSQIDADWGNAIASCPTPTNDALRGCGGITFQAYMKTLLIWQCHVSFVRLSRSSSSDDRKLAREEGCAIEKTLGKMAEHIKATGFMTAGGSWKPLHIDLREKWQLEEDLCAAAIAKPAAVKNPPASASSTEEKTGVTTTSIRNPDGTRTVTKTDKDGNVISTKTVGNSPTSASSTDPTTGVTTTSVRNPDGTRTVTRTDRDGNVLSSERVGKSPDSASSTVVNTGETTKSIANPDGSRTVTRTDKDGNVISTEKVR